MWRKTTSQNALYESRILTLSQRDTRCKDGILRRGVGLVHPFCIGDRDLTWLIWPLSFQNEAGSTQKMILIYLQHLNLPLTLKGVALLPCSETVHGTFAVRFCWSWLIDWLLAAWLVGWLVGGWVDWLIDLWCLVLFILLCSWKVCNGSQQPPS